MPNQSQGTEAEFLVIVDDRIRKWWRWWNIYMWTYYVLGISGVICSTLAASTLFSYTRTPQVLSVVSALCFAIIGFVRPEAKYRNMVRAWTELKAAQEAYRFKADERSELLQALHDGQQIATQDDMQIAAVTSDQKSTQREALGQQLEQTGAVPQVPGATPFNPGTAGVGVT